MKDKFRIRFSYKGWEIQHSRIGILWRTIGGYEYRIKKDAEKIVEELKKVLSCKEWFKYVEVEK